MFKYMLVVIFSVIVLVVISLGYYLSSENNAPTKADVIVVLGGGSNERIFKGAELFLNGYAGYFLLTGSGNPNHVHQKRRLLGNFRVNYLLGNGVKSSHILLNGEAETTWEEAHVVRKLMLSNKWNTALIVSDPPHMRRLRYVYSKVFQDTGLVYQLIITDVDWWDSKIWWSNIYAFKFSLLEVAKLAYYYLSFTIEKESDIAEYSDIIELKAAY
jgi:uncharacterized SAM-binding protein YcdF (DUF218 family)